MKFAGAIFSECIGIFGVLFPALFLVALAVVSVIIYDVSCRLANAALTEQEERKVAERIDGLCLLGTLLGSLQTIISLCLVGFALWFGAMQMGAKAFAILIQGFASTGFGIAIAITGKGYLEFFHGKKLEREG